MVFYGHITMNFGVRAGGLGNDLSKLGRLTTEENAGGS